MHKQTAFYVAIFTATALAIGWYARGLRGARSELASTLSKVPGIKNSRDHLAGVVVLLAVLFAVVLYVIAKKHR